MQVGWTRFWSMLTQYYHTVAADFLYFYDVNLPFQHIPKVAIGLRSDDCGSSENNGMFKKPVKDDLSSVMWHIILLEDAIRKCTVVIKGWT